MNAAIYTRYGPPEVVRVAEIETPTPEDDEVRIRIIATTVAAVDAIFRRGDQKMARMFTGLFRPKRPVLGSEIAGVVDAAGAKVTRFRVGDAVFASSAGFGAHAGYICLSENGAVAPKPANLSFDEAAAMVDGALTALPFLRDSAALQAGQTVLVNGAAGSVGSAAVQLAKHFGATVTGVCSTANVALVQDLGADAVVDYTREDFTRAGIQYDVIFDAVGKSSFGRCRSALTATGLYMTTVLSWSIVRDLLRTAVGGGRRAAFTATGARPAAARGADLAFVKELAEAGSLRPVIDRRFPLVEIAAAHAHVDGGHKRGNVVITVPPPTPS